MQAGVLIALSPSVQEVPKISVNMYLFLIKKSYVKQINVFLSLVFLEVGA